MQRGVSHDREGSRPAAAGKLGRSVCFAAGGSREWPRAWQVYRQLPIGASCEKEALGKRLLWTVRGSRLLQSDRPATPSRGRGTAPLPIMGYAASYRLLAIWLLAILLSLAPLTLRGPGQTIRNTPHP
jgi:hypothetical protein